MPAYPTKRSNSILIWSVVLLLVVGIAFAVHALTRQQLTVRVASPSRQDLVSTVSTNGKVEPVDEFQAHASAASVVQKLYVNIGDKVRPGTLLVQMDDSDARARLASSASAVKTAQLGVANVQQGGSQEELIALNGDINRAKMQQQQNARDLAALQQLEEKGAAAPGEVAAAQQRLREADSSLQSLEQRKTSRYSAADRARAQAQLADAQAATEAARSGYAGANIRSPIAGTVYAVPVSEYDFVPAGDDLVDVADLTKLQVRAYFDEPDFGRLAAGEGVKIVWDAHPNQLWTGHIDRAPTTVITYGTRNVGECIITVDDARGSLLPHSNVTVTVTTARHLNVLSIPREALHTDKGVNFVYRVVNGKLERTPVQLGTVTNLTRVEIASGLSTSDVVALGATGNQDLSNGAAVKIVE